MSRSTLFVITLVSVCALTGYVAFGMFNVGTQKTFEMSRIYFAASILAFLAFIFILSILIYALGPQPKEPGDESPGAVIFDACVKVIPPLATLIIGFYFGTTQNIQEQELPNDPVPVTQNQQQ